MKFFRLLMVFGALITFSSPLYAKSLTLAFVEFPPYEFLSEDKPEGIFVKIVQEVFKRADVSVDLVFYPFKRALLEAKLGHIDGLFNFYKTEERLADFDYSHPVIENPLVFFVRKDSTLDFGGKLSDLKGKRVGAVLGYTYGKEFDETKLFEIDLVNSHEINFKKLAIGRIDAYPCDKLVGFYVLEKEKLLADIQFLTVPLKVMDGHIGFTKGKHTAVIKKINAVIKKMKKSGEIDEIIGHYVKNLEFIL